MIKILISIILSLLSFNSCVTRYPYTAPGAYVPMQLNLKYEDFKDYGEVSSEKCVYTKYFLYKYGEAGYGSAFEEIKKKNPKIDFIVDLKIDYKEDKEDFFTKKNCIIISGRGIGID